MNELNKPFEPGMIYHIWSHANGDENLFRKDENFHYFLERYYIYLEPVLETFAYNLMPNHFHLMARVKSEKVIEKFVNKNHPTLQGSGTLGGLDYSRIVSNQFSRLFNGYAQAYNKQYNRRGSLFIPNFRRKPVESESYYTNLIVYIHWNAVHHGFTDNYYEWPHSSWHEYMFTMYSKLNITEVFDWFGGKNNFIKAHHELKKMNIVSFEDYQ